MRGDLPYAEDIERFFLSILLRFPKTMTKYSGFIPDDLFFNGVHKVIYSVIKKIFHEQGENFDPVIVGATLTDMGLRYSDDVDIVDYIEVVTKTCKVPERQADDYFKQLHKYCIARRICENSRQTEVDVKSNLSEPIDKLVARAEKNLLTTVSSYLNNDDQPKDLYSGFASYIEGLAECEQAEIPTPFDTWNKWWGGYIVGDLNIIAAPYKVGKSTLLSFLGNKAAFEQGMKVLFLDTEMETERVQRRIFASLSNINEAHVRRGEWVKNEDMRHRGEMALKIASNRQGMGFYHDYVANIPIDQVVAKVRRWRANETNPDDKILIVYDYMKITGEALSQNNTEWQVLGNKCDTLKHLCSEVGGCGLAAVQTNQQGDVAASQRIKWFASNCYVLRRKTADEIYQHGKEYGTHKFEALATRNLGPAWETECYVETLDEEGKMTYVENYLNLEFKNFLVEEKGTLADAVKHKNKQLEIEKVDIPKEQEDDGGF